MQISAGKSAKTMKREARLERERKAAVDRGHWHGAEGLRAEREPENCRGAGVTRVSPRGLVPDRRVAPTYVPPAADATTSSSPEPSASPSISSDGRRRSRHSIIAAMIAIGLGGMNPRRES